MLRLLPIAASAFALVIAGCSSENSEDASANGSAISGGERFLAILSEAKDAANDADLTDAARLLEEARELEPENPTLWVDLARLRFRTGDHAGALEAADRAIELDEQFAPALLLRGQLVRDAHGLSQSLVWFEAALEADPDDPLALSEYAATLGDAGYYGAMLEAAERLTELEPANPEALYLKAVLAARAQMPVLAKSLLERSGKLEEGMPAALLVNALVDLQDGSSDSAAETLDRLALMQPGNERVAELLARAMWLGGRDQELVDRFAGRARREAASPYLAMLVGRAYERLGQRGEAAPFLERAYAGRPLGWVALDSDARTDLPRPSARMRDFVSAGKNRRAKTYAARLVREFPGSADVSALAGDAALADGDAESALSYYSDASRIRRPWPLTRKAAAAYRDLGDPLAADVLIARHLVGEPRNTEALLLHAERSARMEDWLRVAVLLDNAIELGAGNDPRLLKLRGIAARKLGDDQGAERFERMTWELHPGLLPEV